MKLITFSDGHVFEEVTKLYAQANWNREEIFGINESEETEAVIESLADTFAFEKFGKEITENTVLKLIEFNKELHDKVKDALSLQKKFPNGFEDWMVTNLEIVSFINDTVEKEGSMACKVQDNEGRGGLYLLAERLTNEFESKYKGVVWGEELEYFDTLGEFLYKKEDECI